MCATTLTPADNTPAARALTELRLAEEHACGGYLTARKAMIRAAARAESLAQLARERTGADYRQAKDNAVAAYCAAAERTRLAYSVWQRAQLRYDTAWSATAGRTPQVPGAEVA